MESDPKVRGAGFFEFGGPDVLRIVELPAPSPGVGEVAISVRAAPVNPTDLLMRSGAQVALMSGLTPPYLAGVEFSGEVAELGEGVSGLSVGMPVMGVVDARRPEGGAYVERIVVPADSVAAIPPRPNWSVYAAVPLNGLTAILALESLALPGGSTLLVTGAAGALGGFCVQLARELGLRVVVDARSADEPWSRALGAEVVVPRGPSMEEDVRRHFRAGVDAAIDAARVGQGAAGSVRDGGRIIRVRVSDLASSRRIEERVISYLTAIRRTGLLRQLADLVEVGRLTPRIAAEMPLERAAVAHRMLEAGGVRGRLVLRVGGAEGSVPG